MRELFNAAAGMLMLACVVYFGFKTFLYVFKPEVVFTFIEAGILTVGILAFFILYLALEYLREAFIQEHNDKMEDTKCDKR